MDEQPLAGVFVLLLEDDAGASSSLLTFLECAGAFVEARPPSEAAATLAHISPDVIIVGVQDPDEGLALRRVLRRHGRGIPTVAIAEGKDQDRLRVGGFDEVVRRPVNAPALSEIIWRAAHVERPRRATPRILIAEDHDDSRELLAALLREYDLVLASNGAEAVERFQHSQPDLVILDVLMPVKDGIEAILAIRRMAPDTKIIAVSGGWSYPGGPDILTEARSFGADVTLRKPLDPVLMREAVHELLDAA